MNLTNDDFKHKIINASPTRLVIVTYEIVLDRITQCKFAIRADDEKSLRENSQNAMQYINELVHALDMEEEVSRQMADLYFYINGLLAQIVHSKYEAALDVCEDIILKLKDALIVEVDDGDSAPVASDSYSDD